MSQSSSYFTNAYSLSYFIENLLSAACFGGHLDVVSKLLENPFVDVNGVCIFILLDKYSVVTKQRKRGSAIYDYNFISFC